MTQSNPPPVDARFQEDCRAEAQRLGNVTIEFKQDPTTQAPVIIVLADATADAHLLYKALYDLADRYDLPVAVVPGSAVSRSSFTAYPAPQDSAETT